MIRVAMVEDDERYRRELTEYLEKYEQESREKIQLTVFTDGDEIVENYRADYDIILMDVEMAFMDGMTAAEHIRKLDTEVVIIFITNMPQYAMKGYKVDALDYVLKPISYYAFAQRIDRALSRMKKRVKKYVVITVKGGFQKIDVSRITYIEVLDHDLMYHTLDSDFMTKGSLSEVKKDLGKIGFFRCNKAYLISLEYVEAIQSNDVLVGGTWLQVSRSKKKALMEALNNYMNEVGK